MSPDDIAYWQRRIEWAQSHQRREPTLEGRDRWHLAIQVYRHLAACPNRHCAPQPMLDGGPKKGEAECFWGGANKTMEDGDGES